MSRCISVFTVAIPVYYTSKFRIPFEATKYYTAVTSFTSGHYNAARVGSRLSRHDVVKDICQIKKIVE
jgi:hypothetical protein